MGRVLCRPRPQDMQEEILEAQPPGRDKLGKAKFMDFRKTPISQVLINSHEDPEKCHPMNIMNQFHSIP